MNKKTAIIAFGFLLVFGALIYFFTLEKEVDEKEDTEPEIIEEDPTKAATSASITVTPLIMEISSTAFDNDTAIPSMYSCDGDDNNPPLTITNTPPEAKSLALIVDDPDAPAGTWVHWTLFNIDPTTTEISENSVPENSVQGLTSFNSQGYGGPCPPSGTHRYFFKIYALDTMLDLDETAKAIDIEQAMEGHIIDKAEFFGTYTHQE